jgi:hypothetical protein
VRYRSSHVFSLGGWTPRLPAGLACPAVLLALPLSRFVYRVLTFFDRLSQVVRPPQKRCWCWAPPLSLATTRGIFSFPQGTEMFQFPHLPPRLHRVTTGYVAGFPHSDITGCFRLHTADQCFSQCTTSFVGMRRQGIPRVPLLALHNVLPR